MTPRVSVVVATRNRRTVLARALASIDSQYFRDFEILVVDDGSVDGTADWLRAEHPAVRLVDLRTACGAAAARNRGVENARGEIVAFLDDDDVWHPSYLAVQVAKLDANSKADLCTTGHLEIDATGRVSRPDLRSLYHYSEPLVRFLAECPIHTLSVVACRREVFERIGSFDESLSIVHDLDWYLRLAVAGGRMEHCSEALVERSLPGGLVTRHRYWFIEERTVHQRIFATGRFARRIKRRVRASRALFFARVSLAKGDLAFGLIRLAEAFLVSPVDAARIAMVRLLRHLPRSAARAWGAETRQVG